MSSFIPITPSCGSPSHSHSLMSSSVMVTSGFFSPASSTMYAPTNWLNSCCFTPKGNTSSGLRPKRFPISLAISSSERHSYIRSITLEW